MAEALAVSTGTPESFLDGKFVIESRSGGKDHEVRVVTAKDGSFYLSCSCPGGKFAWSNKKNPGRGCWAMVQVRKALGMQAI